MVSVWTASATKRKKGRKSLLTVKIQMAVLMSKIETATGTVRVTRMRPGDFSILGAASENGVEISVLHITMHIANARRSNVSCAAPSQSIKKGGKPWTMPKRI